MKLFIAAACFFMLIVLAFGAGLASLGYVAKKKVTAVQQAYKKGDVAGMVNAVTGESSKPEPPPDWKPAPASLIFSPESKIPLRVSLSWVETGHDEVWGDYDSIYQVDSVTKEAVHFRGSLQYPAGKGLERFLGGGSDDQQKVHKIECSRTQYVADLQNSAEADVYFCRQGMDEKQAGTTAGTLSKKILTELRSAGQAEFTAHEDPLQSVLTSFKKAMNSAPGSSSIAAANDLMQKMMSFAPGNNQHIETPAIKCTLRREGADVAFPVLLNDQPAELPAMKLVTKRPDSNEEGGALYVLDDPDNPLILAIVGKSGEHSQITKINWDTETTSSGGGAGREGGGGGGGASQLENELEKNGRAKIYSIYFDFRSDVMRPESNKVLTEIAQIMRKHPDWKLSVEGNTDNIGGDAYNLDLSKRRAAAVKTALVGQYDVSSDRLSTTGFGLSHPVDTNDTIEGRARNRRVELARN